MNKAIFVFLFLSLLQTKYNDIPIKVKSVVQTGKNNQFGGEKVGFWRLAYQVGIDGVVNTEPIRPAN